MAVYRIAIMPPMAPVAYPKTTPPNATNRPMKIWVLLAVNKLDLDLFTYGRQRTARHISGLIQCDTHL